MSAIFISHSSKDNVLAKAIERRLDHHHHHSVFLDLDPEKGIVGGQSWERTLYRKLRACRAVIALCTDDYLRSHWCFAEIALARMEGKPVIAILADPLDAAATMPGILTDRQLIDLRKNEDEGFTRLWRALEQLDLRGVASDWNPKEPPYLGLNAYQEEHAPVFFGREEESLAGLELLDRGAPGLIVVLGASGSGKSSLVRAGMLPRLRSREDWLILDPFRPGRDPWAELTESLVQGYGRYAKAHLDESGRREQIRESIRAGWHVSVSADAPRAVEVDAQAQEVRDAPDERVRRLIDLLERLHEDPPPHLTERVRNYLEWSLDDLRRFCAPAGSAPASRASPHDTTPLLEVAHDLRRLSHRRSARVLLVVDQFEELLGREHVSAGAGGFLELLRASIETEQSPLTVLCTMRSDFLGLFQRHSALQGVDFESLSLGPMHIDGMRRVIEMPARLAAIEIEDGLADRLLADTETPDALPLLSFTLWVMCRDRRDEGKLEVSAYERLGGLHGTITREADAVLASAGRDQKQDDLRKALLQMVRLSEDGSYARRPLDWDSPEVQRVEGLLAKLVDRRVLVSRMEGDRRVIEVAHEALFRTWAPLKAWLENARAELLLTQQIERDARTWRDNGRTPDTLWRGGRLLQARDLMGRVEQRRAAGEADVSAEFVRAGMRRRTRQRAMLLSIAVAMIVVLTGFLGFALVQADRARKEQRRAIDMARVAIVGEWLEKDPTSGALVLLEVADPANTRFAPRRLSEALNRGFISAEYRHTGPVHSVAISPDGSRVLTASANAAMVWEAATGRLLRTLQHDDMVVAAAFDPTGRFVVTRAGYVDEQHAGMDRTGNTARVWEAETGLPRFTVTHADALTGTAFSPDGRFLVTLSNDATMQIWDVEASRLRFTRKPDAAVYDAAFAPDGKLLVTLSRQTAQFWTTEAYQPAFKLAGNNTVKLASFSPDGTILVTVEPDGVRAWAARTGEPVRTFPHENARGASFSTDGRFLVTASGGDARVWDVATGAERFEKPIAQGCLDVAAFSPDGSQVITAAGHLDRSSVGVGCVDNTVRRWDATTGEIQFVKQLPHGFDAMTIAFGPGSHVVAVNSVDRGPVVRFKTRSHDSTARLWNVDHQDRRLQRALEHEEEVSAASFSPDGRRMLTVAGGAVRLWEPEIAAPRFELSHGAAVKAAAFAADGKDVVTASSDGTARVWDATTGQQRFAAKHAEVVEAALLVAGGRLVATISAGTVRLWTVTSGTAEIGGHLLELTGKADGISSDDFSPDGRLVAVRSGEAVWVWDVEARKARSTLKHGGRVNTAVFIANGKLLVTSANEKVVRVWDTTTGEPKFTFDHKTEPQTAVSPDGKAVLTVQFDGTAQLWDTDTGKKRFTFQHGCGAREARFIAEGRLAMTWSYSTGAACVPRVAVWDVATEAERATIDAGDPVSVGFSRDAKLMFTLQDRRSESGTQWLNAATLVRVWDSETAEERFAEPFGSAVPARIAAFSPDGQRLLLVSGKRALIFAVGGELLQSTLVAATTVCLKPEFRRRSLGESDAEAMRVYEACERKHGRK